MDEIGAGTSGGDARTSGIAPILLGGLCIFLAALAIANASSVIADRVDEGIAPWEVWTWEISSILVWCALLPIVWRAVASARSLHLSWPLAVAGLAAGTVPISAAHVAAMVAIRKLVYWLTGNVYIFANDLWGALLYEYRKDVAATLGFVLVFALIQWLMPRRGGQALASEPPMFAVRDGAVIHRVPIDEIDHVASAANYVEIRWRGRTLLHRATLASVEAVLAGRGFARIHRTRLVRRGAIRRTEGHQSGDYSVVLESGETLKGSRRYPLCA